MTSLGAETGETVLDSKAEMSEDARSCALTGVVICEESELSRHHLRLRRGREGARRTMGMYRECSNSRIVSV